MLKEKQNILYISIFVLIMILLFTLGNCGPILDEPSPTELARQDSLKLISAARQESLAIVKENERRQRLQKVIKIKSVWTSEPNCCGGVDIHTVWTNTSNKTIKYISFNWTPYNAVNDVVYGQFGGGSGMITGPISSGQTRGQNRMWECMWYNNTIVRATLDRIKIEYMDGSITIIDGEDIDLVFKKQKR